MENRIHGQFDQIQAGDEIFTDSSVGFCSGGISFNISEKVTNVTDTEIIVGRDKYDRKTGKNQTVYYIACWIKKG